MRQLFCLSLFCLLGTLTAFAQQRVLTGYLIDSITHLPIAGGTLSNPAIRKKVTTDVNGFFRLPVSPDELLYAVAAHYHYDTLRYSFLFQDTITIYLVPVNMLAAVTIETGYKKYQRDSTERRLEFDQHRGHTLHSIDRSKHKPYFGLTLNLDRLFKKKYKNKEKDERSFQGLEQQAYIRHRFSPTLVAFYTGLKGDTLLQFMQLFTPSYSWLRQHSSNEQVIDYLSEKLVQYRKVLRSIQ